MRQCQAQIAKFASTHNSTMKRKNNRKNNRNQKASSLQVSRPLSSKSFRAEVNLQYQVYAVWNSTISTGFYSFSSSLNQVNPTLIQDPITGVVGGSEFARYKTDFAYYKLGSFKILLSNNVFSSSVLTSAPPIYYRMAPRISGTVTADGVARSDASMQYKITNLGNTRSTRFLLPPLLIGSSSNVVGGSSVLIPTDLSMTTNFELHIGYLSAPEFASASSVAVKLVTIDVVGIVEFMYPNIL